MSILEGIIKNGVHDAEKKFAPELVTLRTSETNLIGFFGKFDEPNVVAKLKEINPDVSDADIAGAKADFLAIVAALKTIVLQANLG